MLQPAGSILVNRYRIVSLLGRGSGGATYRGWDQRRRIHVVVKQLANQETLNIRRLGDEVMRLNRVAHAQLPGALDHFEWEGDGYMVFEYVDGVSLQELLDQFGVLSSAQVIEWLQSAAKPLEHIHRAEQLHLDIKPANIRLTPSGSVYLVDNGLSGLGVAPGTSGYAAPEQQGLRSVSPHSDVYALGATLWSLLTGQTPPDALKRETGSAELRSAREVNPDCEPYLSLVAQRAMSLKPEVRYDSVADFSRALRRPSGAPLPTPQIATPRRQPMVSQRQFLQVRRRRQMERRTIWGLLIILGLLVGAAAWSGVLTFGSAETEAGATAEVATAGTTVVQSQLAQALTEVAPSPTPEPSPTPPPTPTPEPIVDELTGARLIFVAADAFRMGDEEGDDDAQPVHRVRLDAYFIDETEVTNGMYAACVEAGGCASPQRPTATYHSSYYGDPNYDDYPVIFVSWDQAQTFCEWRGGRLPTEAEWEYAAGYKTEIAQKLVYPWGNVVNGPTANFCDASCSRDVRDVSIDDGHQDTAPVASYDNGRSPVGAYDMAGNVMEWVWDWYSDDYYSVSSDVNPLGPADGNAKVIRGGSWFGDADDMQVSQRGSYVPEVARANLGFRCAVSGN